MSLKTIITSILALSLVAYSHCVKPHIHFEESESITSEKYERIVSGDFDGNGIKDVAGFSTNYIDIWYGTTDAKLINGKRIPIGLTSYLKPINVCKVNNNLKDDILFISDGSLEVLEDQVLKHTPHLPSIQDFVSGDLDLDGNIDLVILDSIGRGHVLLGSNNGNWVEAPDWYFPEIDPLVTRLTSQDVNRDNHLDILYCDPVGVHILLNNGSGEFHEYKRLEAGGLSHLAVLVGSYGVDQDRYLWLISTTNSVQSLACSLDEYDNVTSIYPIWIPSTSDTCQVEYKDETGDEGKDILIHNKFAGILAFYKQYQNFLNWPTDTFPSEEGSSTLIDFDLDGVDEQVISAYGRLIIAKQCTTVNLYPEYIDLGIGSLISGTIEDLRDYDGRCLIIEPDLNYGRFELEFKVHIGTPIPDAIWFGLGVQNINSLGYLRLTLWQGTRFYRVSTYLNYTFDRSSLGATLDGFYWDRPAIFLTPQGDIVGYVTSPREDLDNWRMAIDNLNIIAFYKK